MTRNSYRGPTPMANHRFWLAVSRVIFDKTMTNVPRYSRSIAHYPADGLRRLGLSSRMESEYAQGKILPEWLRYRRIAK